MTSNRTGLLVTLRPEIGLALVADWPITTLKADGLSYRAVGPEWSGFYDWLRSKDGTVLGVRYHTTEDTRFLLNEASSLSYAVVGQHEEVCIFFGENRVFDPAQSDDQDFAYDQVFVSTGEGSAICFSAENLTPNQLASVTQNRKPVTVEVSK
jgi:hypothetical protein